MEGTWFRDFSGQDLRRALTFPLPLAFILSGAEGRTVLAGSLNPGNPVIDISGFSRGVYFLELGGRAFKVLKGR